MRRMSLISRRAMLAAPLLAGPALSGRRAAAADRAGLENQDLLHEACEALERRHGGRLGVAVLDTAGTMGIAHRGDERFPLCSTFKALAAGFVLAQLDAGRGSLSDRVVYGREDLVTYSPVTERHVGEAGLTMGELCEAAVTLSDNTAANLILDRVGGPDGLTAYLRSIGDDITRLDRRETALNEATPGDPRDTTTPSAMLGTLRRLVLGDALSASSRGQLSAWLVANRTGDRRLRAGAPGGWRIGDKTGSGAYATTNDVAVLWPPGRAPIVVTAYYTGAEASSDDRDAVLAEVGRLATSP